MTSHDLAPLVIVIALITVIVLLVLTAWGSIRAKRADKPADAGTTPPANNGQATTENTPPDDSPRDLEVDAAEHMGRARRWWKEQDRSVRIKIERTPVTLKFDSGSTCSGEIDGSKVEFYGEQDLQASADVQLSFSGRVSVKFAGAGTVQIGLTGVVVASGGGEITIRSNGDVLVSDGPSFETRFCRSVSASAFSEFLQISATSCNNVFGGENVRLLAARCGTVYASNGDVFAYYCAKVHASHDASVYAVNCDDVLATGRSRVLHYRCGDVSKLDEAILEEQKS